MKRVLALLIALMIVLSTAALAETGSDTVFGYGMVFDRNATYVNLRTTRITDVDKLIAFMGEFPNLELIEMFSTTFRREEINKIKAAFPDVRVGCQLYIADHRVRTDAQTFSTWHPDTEPGHATIYFEPLRYCYNLVALDLGHNRIDDLSFLAEMPQLRYLILADNRITDLTPLTALKDLQYLELFMNDITDLEPLTHLPNLLDLNLCMNEITDYTPLYRMPSLERLWLSKSNDHSVILNSSSQIYLDLQAALPDCLIDTDSVPSTSNGWRTHPRYQQIILKTFKSGVYYPIPENGGNDTAQ